MKKYKIQIQRTGMCQITETHTVYANDEDEAYEKIDNGASEQTEHHDMFDTMEYDTTVLEKHDLGDVHIYSVEMPTSGYARGYRYYPLVLAENEEDALEARYDFEYEFVDIRNDMEVETSEAIVTKVSS